MHSGPATTRWRLGHRPGLDGLRGVAIVLVLFGHLIAPWWLNAYGAIGVTVFFTLSGFLITALLLGERGRTGRVAWGNFYLRRALRLLPALAALVVLVGIPSVMGGLIPLSRLLAVVFYVGNWPKATGHGMVFLAHTWSLAVEEQFYLVWPVVLVVASRWRNGLLVVAGVGIATSISLRFLLWDGGHGLARVYAGTDTRADALLVGCGLAVLLSRGVKLRVPAQIVPLLLVGMVALGSSHSVWGWGMLVPTVIPWVTAALIIFALDVSRGWATSPSLLWMGRRSYGIYLWHFPLVQAAWLGTHSAVVMAIALAISLPVAEASWRWIEQPFLRLKDRTRLQADRSGHAGDAADVLVADNRLG